MPDRMIYLGPHDMYRLDQACMSIVDAFAGTVPYLVGSVWTRPNFRDVDVRLMLADGDLEAMFAGRPNLRALINCALSDWLARASGLPVDFQIQTVTEGNEHKGPRSALGVRYREATDA